METRKGKYKMKRQMDCNKFSSVNRQLWVRRGSRAAHTSTIFLQELAIFKNLRACDFRKERNRVSFVAEKLEEIQFLTFTPRSMIPRDRRTRANNN